MTTLIVKYLTKTQGSFNSSTSIFELLDTGYSREENQKVMVQLRTYDLIHSQCYNQHLWKVKLPFKQGNVYQLTFTNEEFICCKLKNIIINGNKNNNWISWEIDLENLNEVKEVAEVSEKCSCCETIAWLGGNYCLLHKEKCHKDFCSQRVVKVGDCCLDHQGVCKFENCAERINQTYCKEHGLEEQVEIYRERWEEKNRQVVRIESKLGEDLSDEKLEEFKNSFDLLTQVRAEINNRPDITIPEYGILVRERDNLRVNLITTQQRLNQTQSERDGYQSRSDAFQKELEQKQEAIRQLTNEVKEERLENVAHGEMLERRHFEQRKGDIDDFLTIQIKQKELKQLRSNLKNKLDSSQKFLISTLLTSQEQLIRLERISTHLVSLNKKQLQKIKQNLKTKLSDEETNKLCSLQSEITKLEMKLESLQEQLQARIEVNINN